MKTKVNTTKIIKGGIDVKDSCCNVIEPVNVEETHHTFMCAEQREPQLKLIQSVITYMDNMNLETQKKFAEFAKNFK